MKKKILIVDFGSQYSQLIARRIREMEVYCEIVHHSQVLKQISEEKDFITGVILSGGPESVYEENSPAVEKELFFAGLPVLGICYGMQLIAHLNGGSVERAETKEFGKASLEILDEKNPLFKNVKVYYRVFVLQVVNLHWIQISYHLLQDLKIPVLRSSSIQMDTALKFSKNY